MADKKEILKTRVHLNQIKYMQLYVNCFIVGILGMILQVFIKMKSLQNKSLTANEPWSPKMYFQKDWLSLCASVTTIIMSLFLINEVFNWSPKLVDYVKWIFAFVGYTGSDIMTRVFGVMNKQLNNVINEKTDIADNKKPSN